MKYPNPKFAGMSIVTSSAIKKAILDYYPNATQTGGAQRLDLLKKATDQFRTFVSVDSIIYEPLVA